MITRILQHRHAPAVIVAATRRATLCYRFPPSCHHHHRQTVRIHADNGVGNGQHRGFATQPPPPPNIGTTTTTTTTTMSEPTLSQVLKDPNVTLDQLPPKKRRRLRTLAVLAALSLSAAAVFNLQDEDTKSWQLGVLKSLPLNALSRMWGAFHRLTLPEWARVPMYKLWILMFNVNESEIDRPLTDFVNLGQFFVRPLKAGVRPVGHESLVSPVDAKVTVISRVAADGTVEQIKGSAYQLQEFLGFLPPPLTRNRNESVSEGGIVPSLHYIVLYLAPGDYHRIHNPASTVYEQRRHFPGHLFPVAPALLAYVPSLFIRNERVVLSGLWRTERERSVTEHPRFFSMTMVGAYNVGSVKLSYDEELVTNARTHVGHWRKWRDHFHFFNKHQVPHMDTRGEKPSSDDLTAPIDTSSQYVKHYGRSAIEHGEVKPAHAALDVEARVDMHGLRVAKGEEVACFELGSTVVLVFETHIGEDFQWLVKEGDTVKMGQSIGDIVARRT